MRWLQSFWGPEVAHFGPLDGTLSTDLEVSFFRLKLYFNYVKFHLNPFSRFRLADLFPKMLRYKPLCSVSMALSVEPGIPREYLGRCY